LLEQQILVAVAVEEAERVRHYFALLAVVTVALALLFFAGEHQILVQPHQLLAPQHITTALGGITCIHSRPLAQ